MKFQIALSLLLKVQEMPIAAETNECKRAFVEYLPNPVDVDNKHVRRRARFIFNWNFYELSFVTSIFQLWFYITVIFLLVILL